MLLAPCTFLIVKKVSQLFRYSAHKKEIDTFLPCLTRLNMGRNLKHNLYKQFFLVYYYTSLKLHGTFYP